MQATINVQATTVDRLSQLEGEIEAGLELIYRGGTKWQRALAEIRSDQLWRGVRDSFSNPIYKDFSHYCQVRWGRSARTIYEHAQAGQVAHEMIERGVSEAELPKLTAHLLELSQVAPSERAGVLQEVREANDGKVTSKAIQQAAQRVIKPEIGKDYRVTAEGNPDHGKTISVVNLVGGMALDERSVPFLPAELEPVDPEPPKPKKLSLREQAERYRELLVRTLACELTAELRSEIEAALA